jgi:hypothetical protein
VGVRDVPLKNCFGLFQAARAGRLRIKAKYPECQGLALRVAIIRRVTSHIKNSNETTPMASKEKSPPALTYCCLTAIEAAANAMLMVTAHLTTSHL